ncbi:sodium channel and clathrin linker 1-like [Dunckerocampus dactyliophorus]|uniref:sodium channel and clathrin linker 1-like n=1 Tax=Dunckerocampus dactyliophorus TaxID=161453 RepID=UPI002405B994|nr:sodium channel and clathrin linker 1-like [Dunckerocampus dactyliophorus]
MSRSHLHQAEAEEVQGTDTSVHAEPSEEKLVVDDDALIQNYETQVQLFLQERWRAMEMWPTAVQGVEQLKELYHKAFEDGQNPDAMTQKLKDQLIHFTQQSRKLQVVNQEVQSRNKQLLTTVTEQNEKIEELHTQLRKTSDDLRTATAKTDELTKQLQSVEHQRRRQEEDAGETQQLQSLQSIFNQREEKPKAWPEGALEEPLQWEKTVGALQARCAVLEQEKYDVLNKVHESMQVADAIALQDVAKTLIRRKQKADHLENKDRAIQQLIQEAAVRTRKEVVSPYCGSLRAAWDGTAFTFSQIRSGSGKVTSEEPCGHMNNLTVWCIFSQVDIVREQCNIEIHRIAEELSHMQMTCALKDCHIERSNHEKKALLKELEMVTKCRADEDIEKTSALHQRCLSAERIRDEMSITLQSTQCKLKKVEMDSSVEAQRSQEEVQRLQGCLAAAWKDRDNISEDRLQLQQQNLQLHREMDELHRTSLLAQNTTRHQMLQMEQETKLKVQAFHAQMLVLEETSRSLNADRIHLLTAQQKSLQQSKDEATNMAKAFEARIQHLTTETHQHKLRLRELELQLTNNQDTMAEYERQIAEYQDKSVSLQRRLTQAEQRAAAATQQLSSWTSQRTALRLQNEDFDST